MTQEARNIAHAFVDGKSRSCRRTHTDGDNVYLFGNRIAYRDEHGMVWLSLAGWPTVTTRDRLNAILGAFGADWRFYQAKFVQYAGTVEVGCDEWIPIAGELGMQALMAERATA